MKTTQGMKFAIGKPDTMWIVKYAWDKSFVNIETNKYVISYRGWGGLIYMLLDHPELKAIKDHLDMMNLTDDGDRYFPQESLHNMNMTEGLAGETVELLLEDRAKEERLEGVDRATRDRNQRETAQENFEWVND
jgi:hypothetical protein